MTMFTNPHYDFQRMAKAARERIKARHDGLCIVQTEGAVCHCMGKCCFENAQRKSAKGTPMGMCICRYCPCYSASRWFSMKEIARMNAP